LGRLVSFILSISRTKKRVVTLVIDSISIFIAFWLSLFIRLDNVNVIYNVDYWLLVSIILPVCLFSLVSLGLYRAVLRYMSSQALWAVVAGASISTASLLCLSFFLGIEVPRTVPIIFSFLSFLLIGGPRLVVRLFVEKNLLTQKEAVIIYGAGSAGRQLAHALNLGEEYRTTGFIDDDDEKHNTIIQGISVYNIDKLERLISQNNVTHILLALPSASRSCRKKIVTLLEPLPVKVQTIPGMADMVNGSAEINELKDIEIEDLLGRDSITPNPDLMTVNITDKVVMITGAGGSIGSELCHQIITQKPKKIILFDLSEYSLYIIDKELSDYKVQHNLTSEILPIIGSVQNINTIERVFKTFNVQTVYHAAAYKHVPLVELNVIEGVRNNVFGTLKTAKAAINAQVEKFVLVSSDKAVRPTNVMGTSKRMAELCLQALAKVQTKTRFSMVRFGNVLGSSGSVVPLFRQQIKTGGPVTITHPEITRYFMTISEAAQLVIQAGAMGHGGDVFVLEMGESVKIKDLAENMIHLSGCQIKNASNPEGDIEIQYTGLRPGEKLYEELLIGDNVRGTRHKRIMTADEVMLNWQELSIILEQLEIACDHYDHKKIRQILIDAPTGFNPTDDICDLVWRKRQLDFKDKPKLKTVS